MGTVPDSRQRPAVDATTNMKRYLEPGIAHLRKSDETFGTVIDAVGPCTLTLRRDRFDTLVRSILSQQLSTAAARTIRNRLVEQIGIPRPETLLAMTDDEFRACGVSLQKASYLRDLATRVEQGELPLGRLGRLSDEGVIERLIAVKGIGRWTAQMFLIFSLGRPDVFPHDDLGIRNAIRRLYGFSEMPRREEMDAVAAPWRPYASIACWYLWQSLSVVPVGEPTNGRPTAATGATTTNASKKKKTARKSSGTATGSARQKRSRGGG